MVVVNGETGGSLLSFLETLARGLGLLLSCCLFPALFPPAHISSSAQTSAAVAISVCVLVQLLHIAVWLIALKRGCTRFLACLLASSSLAAEAYPTWPLSSIRIFFCFCYLSLFSPSESFTVAKCRVSPHTHTNSPSLTCFYCEQQTDY